jgi:beta-1,4-mannosyl-glycoprotein beta-1,4-N-acetylglucosaminyltransferase
MYNNEDLVLDIRLNILDKFVHKFVIVESCYDHQGNKKKLNFDIKKFKKFKKKINYIILKKFPENLTSWERENYNRNYLEKGLREASDEDYIMISDLDEIPKIKNYNIFYKKKFTVFRQKMIYYRFNLQNITNPNWFGTKACKKKYLKTPQWLRDKKIKNYPLWRLDKISWNIVKNGGWHFSYVMSYKRIIDKLKSFAHIEYNNQKYLNIRLIKKKISEKKDLFNRPIKFSKIKDEKKLPNYVIKNKKKFKSLMV